MQLHDLLADTSAGHNLVASVFVECHAMYRAGGPAEMRPVGETEFANGVAAMSAAIRMPVPVAESQLSVYTAASGVGFVTTGGMRTTRLCRPSMGNFGAEIAFRKSLACGSPQMKTNTLRIAHGVQALMIWARVNPCRTAFDSASS